MHTLFDNPEVAEADRVLARHEVNHGGILDWLRDEMVRLYLERVAVYGKGSEEAFVCADDARRILDARPEYDGLCRNFLGQLWRVGGWVQCGMTKSTTPGSHGNLIRKWRMK